MIRMLIAVAAGTRLDFGENAVLTGCDGNYVARLSSPAAAQRRLYRHCDTQLIRFRTA
jgi:hypothetical protein